MRTAILSALSAAFILVGAAPAAAFDYTYLEGGIALANGSDPDVDGDGPWVALSLEASPEAHIFAHFRSSDLDVTRVGVTTKTDEEQWGVGLGSNQTVTPDLDVLLRASYERVQADGLGAGGGTRTDNGFALEVGIRAMPVGRVEVNGGVAFRYLDSKGDTRGRIGAVVPFTDRAGLSARVEVDKDRTDLLAGLRVSF
jgi:hypothetical protein